MAITRGANKRAQQALSSPLLSLPWEVREMIWKAVIGSEPYLLHPVPFKWQQLQTNITTQCTAVSPSYLSASCMTLHRRPAHTPCIPKPRPHSASPTQSGALSWLRTCRLIYHETKKHLTNNISLHVCDTLYYQAALKQGSPSLPFSQIRTLTICVPIKVLPCFADSFRPIHGAVRDCEYTVRCDHGKEFSRWASWITDSCSALNHAVFSNHRKTLVRLEKLTLHVFFECLPFHGYGHYSHCGLRWLDSGSNKEDGRRLVESRLCHATLLEMFVGEGVPALEVNFDLEKVRHDPWNVCLNGRNQCWCTGNWIMEESVPTEEIEKYFRYSLLKKENGRGIRG